MAVKLISYASVALGILAFILGLLPIAGFVLGIIAACLGGATVWACKSTSVVGLVMGLIAVMVAVINNLSV